LLAALGCNESDLDHLATQSHRHRQCRRSLNPQPTSGVVVRSPAERAWDLLSVAQPPVHRSSSPPRSVRKGPRAIVNPVRTAARTVSATRRCRRPRQS